jgi:hypothetical protein
VTLPEYLLSDFVRHIQQTGEIRKKSAPGVGRGKEMRPYRPGNSLNIGEAAIEEHFGPCPGENFFERTLLIWDVESLVEGINETLSIRSSIRFRQL